jgi:hypothetical protein
MPVAAAIRAGAAQIARLPAPQVLRRSKCVKVAAVESIALASVQRRSSTRDT